MPETSPTTPNQSPSRSLDRLLAATAILLFILAIGWPALRALVSVAGHLDAARLRDAIPSARLLLTSLAWALGIATLSACFAWPAAWLIRRRGWTIAPLLATPLLMPTALGYTALGLARAPGTFLGDRLERLVGQGWPDAPMLASKLQAFLGLALWSWPLAAFVLAAGFQRIDASTIEQFRLDTRSRLRRHIQLALATRASILAAISAVALITLGSAVPLHLAEAPTLAAKVWMQMTIRPGDPGIWTLGWPNLAAAAIAAWIISKRLIARETNINHDPLQRDPSTPGFAQAIAIFITLASTLLPLALLASSIRHARSVRLFWIYSGDAFAQSLAVGAITSLLVAIVGLWTWRLASASSPNVHMTTPRAGPCRSILLLTLTTGLLPGVLIGKATTEAWAFLPALQDSLIIVVLGHTARFAFIGALAGLWLARAEPSSLRDLRAVDGQHSFTAWFGAVFRARWPMLGAVMLAVTCLSLHEIEASIFLQPPGLQTLSQTLLGYLHYSRLEELSAACVWIVGSGLIAAIVATRLASMAMHEENRPS